MSLSIANAQIDLRHGYYSGAAGIFASSLAWFVAAGVAALLSPDRGVWALLIGGMLIHPVGLLICKLLGAPGRHSVGNPLASLAGASTVWLIASLPLAYVISRPWVDWFFPAMLLVIGGRYTVFATLYGMRLYWLLGVALIAAAMSLVSLSAPAAVGALTGATLEAVFAVICLLQHRRWTREQPASTSTPAP